MVSLLVLVSTVSLFATTCEDLTGDWKGQCIIHGSNVDLNVKMKQIECERLIVNYGEANEISYKIGDFTQIMKTGPVAEGKKPNVQSEVTLLNWKKTNEIAARWLYWEITPGEAETKTESNAVYELTDKNSLKVTAKLVSTSPTNPGSDMECNFKR